MSYKPCLVPLRQYTVNTVRYVQLVERNHASPDAPLLCQIFRMKVRTAHVPVPVRVHGGM